MKNPWDVDDNENQASEKNQNSNKPKANKERTKRGSNKIENMAKNIFNNLQNRQNRKTSENKSYGFLVLIVIFVLMLIWLSSGVYKVNSDENAVVLYFGKYYTTTSPGLHFYFPKPIGKIVKIGVTRINKEEFGFSSAVNNRKAFDEESLMLTGDENIADIDFEVQWKIGNIKDYLFNIKNQKNTIRSATESVMREIIANREIDDILANKKFAIESEARQLLQTILDSYGSGIEIVTVQLLRADPPKEVINAFRDVQTAKADKESKINEAKAYSNDILPKARGEAEAVLQSAEAYKRSTIAKAEGETSRFNQIYNEYRLNKDITKRRMYLETMEEVMRNNEKVIVDKNSNSNIIQLLNNK